jgi:hypothetical protein
LIESYSSGVGPIHGRAGAFFGVALALFSVVVLAVFGSGAWAAGSLTTSLTRYSDRAGWSVTYPRTMRLERSGRSAILVSESEVTIANFRQRTAVHLTHSGGGTQIVVDPPLERNGRFPADGVAFRMFSFEGGPPGLGQVPDSRLPILLSRFKPPQNDDFPGGDGDLRGVPSSRDLQINADGEQYTGIVLIGPRASRRQRAELARAIASLRFAALQSGSLVNGLAVLAPADHYPVGSFTLVQAPNASCGRSKDACRYGATPFYLVHAPGRLSQPDLIQPCPEEGGCTPPGAFYAIGWTSPFLQGG